MADPVPSSLENGIEGRKMDRKAEVKKEGDGLKVLQSGRKEGR